MLRLYLSRSPLFFQIGCGHTVLEYLGYITLSTASGLQDAFSKLCKSIRLTDTQKVLHECAAMHLLWRRGLLRINEGQLKLPDEYWIYYFMGLNNGANAVLDSYLKVYIVIFFHFSTTWTKHMSQQGIIKFWLNWRNF